MKVSRLAIVQPGIDGHRFAVELGSPSPRTTARTAASERQRWERCDWTRRLKPLYEALLDRLDSVVVLSGSSLTGWAKYWAAVSSFSADRSQWRERYHKNAFTFTRSALETERRLLTLSPRADLVLHLLSLSSPYLKTSSHPYVMYVDYTMALAERDWPPWAPFRSRRGRDAWMARETRAYLEAAHIFTWTEYAKQSLVADYGVPAARVTAVGAPGRLPTSPLEAKPFRGRTLLFVQSNFHRKGGDLLFEAFATLRARDPRLRLQVVGGPIPDAPPGVEYLGYVADAGRLASIFREADVLVLPSRCEPTGVVIAEAMGHGVPCVVTDCGGMPEVVEDGLTGFVVPKEDGHRLAHAIERLLTDGRLWMEMSRRCQEKVRQQLDWSRVADTMLQVIADLPDRPQGRAVARVSTGMPDARSEAAHPAG